MFFWLPKNISKYVQGTKFGSILGNENFFDNGDRLERKDVMKIKFIPTY